MFALAFASNHQVHSQEFGHTDVLFEYGEDKIQTNGRTFTSFFPTSGISRQFQTLPGFASETDVGQGLLPNDQLVYNVLSDLQFWADGELRPGLVQDIQIRINNRPSTTPETIVSSSSGEQLGSFDPPRNRIGKASENGNFHSDLQWFLETTEMDSTPPKGTYAIQMNVATNREGIAESDPFYFIWHFGADSTDFENAVAFWDAQLDVESLIGDFDHSGSLDTNDVELLVNAIRDETNETRFDVFEDAEVDLSDLDYWVSDLALTWHGDVDLDGEFSSSDLVAVFQGGAYETDTVASWVQGDWNADSRFGSSDLVMAFQDGGYERGPRNIEARPVPEPFGVNGLVFCFFAFFIKLHHRSSKWSGRRRSGMLSKEHNSRSL